MLPPSLRSSLLFFLVAALAGGTASAPGGGSEAATPEIAIALRTDALNARRLRGSEDTDAQTTPVDEDISYFDAPEGWIEADQAALEKLASNTEHEEGNDDELSEQLQPQATAGSGDSNFLHSACQARYCVMFGYLVVPGAACTGTEAIDGGNAGSYDYLFNVALSQCGGSSCVLIVNPVGHRTQEQLHIHFRHYNGGGAAMKHRLESTVCSKDGWVNLQVSPCASGKVRLFRSFPGVFSVVAQAYGGGSLVNVGIEVWPGSCGGGVLVQTTLYCSIEHDISAR